MYSVFNKFNINIKLLVYEPFAKLHFYRLVTEIFTVNFLQEKLHNASGSERETRTTGGVV
ncbi:hypothetical protein BSNK01_29610 [Bacillaceae bacterium]